MTSTWDNADDEMEALLGDLNAHGFAFNRDFILKTCLTLLGQGAGYEVEKFRKAGIRKKIEEKWKDIAKAIKDVLDFVRGKTFIRCDKALPSYLVLIPLVHVRYNFPEAWVNSKDVDNYLLRSSLTGAFGGQPDQLIDDLVKRLNEIKKFDLQEVFGIIRSKNRSLELTEGRFWEMGYGSDTIHRLFNLWYRDFNYSPAFDGNFPQVDHILPKSQLLKIKKQNPTTGAWNLTRYKESDRNQLANCMLLTAAENGAGGKSDTPPNKWFPASLAKDRDYLTKHLIRNDPALWQVSRFEDFIAACKALIGEKFKPMLVAGSAVPPAAPTTTLAPA